MLRIEWDTEDVQGWADYIDLKELREMRDGDIYVHDSDDANGIPYRIGCHVSHDEGRFVLNYGVDEARRHNRRLDGGIVDYIYNDIVRITLATGAEELPALIELRGEGEPHWRSAGNAKHKLYTLTLVEGASEGSPVVVSHVRRERSRWLRDQALARQRLEHSLNFCQVCEWDDGTIDAHLSKRYARTQFYEVHHLTPLARGPAMNDVASVAVLCPTCHRASHSLGDDMPSDLTLLRTALLQ